jgi:hypothetical protein
MKFVLITTSAVLLGGCVNPAAQQAHSCAPLARFAYRRLGCCRRRASPSRQKGNASAAANRTPHPKTAIATGS